MKDLRRSKSDSEIRNIELSNSNKPKAPDILKRSLSELKSKNDFKEYQIQMGGILHNEYSPPHLNESTIADKDNKHNSGEIKSAELSSETSSPLSGQDSYATSPHIEKISNNDTRETVTPSSDTPRGCWDKLRQLANDYLTPRGRELKRRATFDKLYSEAWSRLSESSHGSSRQRGPDRTNHADADPYRVPEKLRSKQIIAKLRGAIKKFDSDKEVLLNSYIRDHDNLKELLRKDIRQTIEKEPSYQAEMQRRRRFDEIEKSISKALEESKHSEDSIRHKLDNLQVDDTKEQETEMQLRQCFDESHNSKLDILEKAKDAENLKRKEFDEFLENHIDKELSKRLEIGVKHLLGSFNIRKEEVVSEFQKEIEQIKVEDGYRRYGKDSKSDTQEPKGKEQKDNKELRAFKRYYQSQRTGLTDSEITLRRRAKRLAQIGHPAQSFQWMHLWPNKQRR